MEARLAALEVEELHVEFKRRAEADHMFFCEHVLGYKDLDHNLHGEVSRLIDGTSGKKKKLFLLPRGHLKSSLVTVGWVIWLIVKDPNRTIAIFNETQDLAEAFLREVKDHLEGNAVLRKYWPGLVPDEKKVWNRSAIIVNRTRLVRTPTVEAKSIEESTAGRHPDIMILDDPVSDRTVRTEDGIRKSKQKFQELQALLEPPSDEDPFVGMLIVIGTRWHWQDLYNYIMEKLGAYYDVHIRKAIEDGKVIFPQKFTKKLLAEMRTTMGEWVFSSQMMNEPVDSASAIFPKELIDKRTWEGDRDHFLTRMHNFTYLAVDPAWDGEDATGIVVGAMTSMGNKGKLYVLDAVRSRMKPDEMLEHVIALALRWRVQKIGFEGVVGGQEWMIKNLRELLEERDLRIPVIALSHGNKSKNARILGLVPELQFARLYLHQGCEELRMELLQFPRSSYRDLMDALEMLTRIATPPGKTRDRPARSQPGTGEYDLRLLENKRRHRRQGYSAR